jgi:hypothetical protein
MLEEENCRGHGLKMGHSFIEEEDWLYAAQCGSFTYYQLHLCCNIQQSASADVSHSIYLDTVREITKFDCTFTIIGVRVF